jgi:hypothetical protein
MIEVPALRCRVAITGTKFLMNLGVMATSIPKLTLPRHAPAASAPTPGIASYLPRIKSPGPLGEQEITSQVGQGARIGNLLAARWRSICDKPSD